MHEQQRTILAAASGEYTSRSSLLPSCPVMQVEMLLQINTHIYTFSHSHSKQSRTEEGSETCPDTSGALSRL